MERALGVILLGDGRAEDRHDCVADELLDRATRLVDLGGERVVQTLEQRARLLGVLAGHELRRADHVGEENGHHLPVAAGQGRRSPRQPGGRYGRPGLERRILPEDRRLELAESLARLEPESLDQEAHSLRIATLLQAQPSAESGIRHSELLGLVGRILRRFPPNERVVMDLVLDGLPTNEIVDLLSPERYQNVVNRIYRARKKLQRALAKHGYEVPQACTKNRGRKAALSSRS